MDALVAALDAATMVVVFTGAGASAESGIPTFRGSAASWWAGPLGVPVMGFFGTPFGWTRAPWLAWPVYDRTMRRAVLTAQPNAAHRGIAALATPLREVRVATQNVDGLHQRAGTPAAHVAEVHGTLWRDRCTKCGAAAAAVDPATVGEAVYAPHAVPYCPDCGGWPRPDATLFGECTPYEQTRRADAFVVEAVRVIEKAPAEPARAVVLIVGLSGKVGTCNHYILRLAGLGVPTFVVDPAPSMFTDKLAVHHVVTHVALPAAAAFEQLAARGVYGAPETWAHSVSAPAQ
jgi:NAD-dependent deacetylase